MSIDVYHWAIMCKQDFIAKVELLYNHHFKYRYVI